MIAKRLPVPKGIVFDLGGTLLRQQRLDPVAGLRRLLALSENRDTVDVEAFRKTGDELVQNVMNWRSEIRECGISSVELRFQSLLWLLVDRFGLETSLSLSDLELEFWKASCSMGIEPGVKTLFEHLSRRRIPSGLVSNTLFSCGPIEWELERHGLSHYLSFVMASADYGVRKPHPALFLTAARKLALKPTEVWFVGNQLETDIVGAQQAGMVPVWYTREYRKPSGYDGLCVANWAEFVSGLMQV